VEIMPRHKLTDEERKRGGKNSKRRGLDEILSEMASEMIVEVKDKNGKVVKTMTADEAINQKLIEQSIKGDIRFVKEYNDRRFGKAKQTIEQIGPTKSPFDLDGEEEQFLQENYDETDTSKSKKTKSTGTVRKKASPTTVARKKTSRNT
jgi:hypothetical protein